MVRERPNDVGKSFLRVGETHTNQCLRKLQTKQSTGKSTEESADISIQNRILRLP